MKKFALIAVALLLLTACEQQKSEQIQWQMPLEAPEDLHGGNDRHLDVPLWATARQGSADLVWLQKSTTKRVQRKLALGGRIQVKDMEVELLGLASGLRIKNKSFLDDENVDNPAAFVRISRNDKVIYQGWLYEKFPELFGMDDPEWKVWLKGITLRPAS